MGVGLLTHPLTLKSEPDSSLRASSLFGRYQRLVIVWLGRELLDVLGVLDLVVLAHHEDSPLEEPKLLDQDTVVGGKLLVLVRRRHSLLDAVLGAPAGLAGRQVHAD